MQHNLVIKPLPSKGKILLLMTAFLCLQAVTVYAAPSFRIGFSRSVIGEVNENDAMAVIKIWANELVSKENLPVDPQPAIYNGKQELETALKENKVECISITATEFFQLQDLVDRNNIIFPVKEERITEEFVLLVRKDGPIETINDLSGSSLQSLKNTNTILATIWLDVELAKAGLPKTERYFHNLAFVKKVNYAILPVFFGKKDACLVTRKGFETMAELNPQISEKLKVLCASKEYITNFLVFRNNYNAPIKATILKKIEEWDRTPAGQQILTIFQTDALRQEPFECLIPTLALIKEHQHLFTKEKIMDMTLTPPLDGDEIEVNKK